MLVQNIASTLPLYICNVHFCVTVVINCNLPSNVFAIEPDTIIQVPSFKYVNSLSNLNQTDCPTMTVIDLQEKTVADFKVTLVLHIPFTL